jgi:cell division protein FtsB
MSNQKRFGGGYLSQTANPIWIDRITASDKINSIARRRVRTRRFIDSLVLMITLAAAAVCISAYFRTRAELETALSKHQAVSSRLGDLRIRVDRLSDEVQRLRADPKAIEAFARQNLGYVRSGEVVITLPITLPPNTLSPNTLSPNTLPDAKQSTRGQPPERQTSDSGGGSATRKIADSL